jgi:hypothetical protein
MTILPNADKAVIHLEKFTKYILDPERSLGKHVAFERALGYNLGNADKLINNIRSNLSNFEAAAKSDKGHGWRYEVRMLLTGENGKTANVVTAWIIDNVTGETRLTSAYVKDKKGGQRDD